MKDAAKSEWLLMTKISMDMIKQLESEMSDLKSKVRKDQIGGNQ